MRIDIITCLPELLHSFLNHSIMKRAQDKNHVTLVVHDLRDFGKGQYRQIDDYPFGGGAGMVIMAEPIVQWIERLQSERNYQAVIYMTPDGSRLNQKQVNTMSLLENIIIICGHYKGIDDRVRQHFITQEISIGDYVLSGGELPAAVLADALVRLVPGVLGDETSALTDSFQDNLLAPPIYTRPENFRGWEVPQELVSGNHKLIDEWRYNESVKRTQLRRPDLLEDSN
jgi:tRNA (guanine37-N1)-methyltransferase